MLLGEHMFLFSILFKNVDKRGLYYKQEFLIIQIFENPKISKILKNKIGFFNHPKFFKNIFVKQKKEFLLLLNIRRNA